MTKILKSDLTYSLTGGFAVGAFVMFVVMPAAESGDFGQSLIASISAVGQLFG